MDGLEILRLDHLYRTIQAYVESEKDAVSPVTRLAIETLFQDHRSLRQHYPHWVHFQACAAKDQRPPVTREPAEALLNAVAEEPAPEIIGESVSEWIEEEVEQPDQLPDGTENKQKSYGLRAIYNRLVDLLRRAPDWVKKLEAYEKLWDRMQALWDSFM